MQDIIPMSKSEIKRLDGIMDLLKRKHMCSASVLNFDNDTIFVELKREIKNDMDGIFVDGKIKINRITMEVEEKELIQ